jgi:hypothetical protein
MIVVQTSRRALVHAATVRKILRSSHLEVATVIIAPAAKTAHSTWHKELEVSL